MSLNSYQLHIIRDIRSEERPYGIKIISLSTGSGYFSSLDAYRRNIPDYTEVLTYFSGALLFDPFSQKKDIEAGFYKTSQIIIVASRDNKTVLQAKDVKIEYQSIKFRIEKIIDCEDTEEIVIYASRLE